MTVCAARQSNTPILRCPIEGSFSLVCVFLLFVTVGDSFLFFVILDFGSGLLISSSIFGWNSNMISHIDECLINVIVDLFIEMYLLEINDLDSSFTPNSVSEG
jgi:hypothetical protein